MSREQAIRDMIPAAEKLVKSVDRRDPITSQQILRDLDRQQLMALAVVLAEQVPAGRGA